MKKRSTILLSIATLICLLVTAGSWRYRYHIHAERVAAWNKVAQEAFREALMMEVEKRGHIEASAIEQYPESAKTLITPAPDFVTLEIEGCVKREFPIPKERYEHRLIEELNSMSLFSFLLEGYPLSLDTLNRNWDSLLLARKVAAQTYVRYTYTDFLEHDSVAYLRLPAKSSMPTACQAITWDCAWSTKLPASLPTVQSLFLPDGGAAWFSCGEACF